MNDAIPSAGRRLAIHLALVLGSGFFFLFYGLGSLDFLDPDEGMYGSIAAEMAATGDWITPRFNGVRYLEKPPLQFWLAALTVSALGPSEWAVRLWSAVPGFGTALLTWRLGSVLYGGPAGVLAAMVMVSSIGVFRYARVAATDFLLVFSLTLALYGVVRAAVTESSAGRWLVVFWFGVALGVLSKGLIGVVFPSLIIGLFFLVDRWWGDGAARRLRGLIVGRASVFGLALFLLLVLPWHVLAAWKNPGFFEFYVVDNQWLRFFHRRAFLEDDIPVGSLAFLVLTLVWFFPWSFFIPSALRQGFPRLSSGSSTGERLRWLVGLWTVAVLGFFSLSASKLEHYFLPAIPPLSLMVGATWARIAGNGQEADVSRGVQWSLGVATLGCWITGLGLFWFRDRFTPELLLAGLAELNVYYRILEEQGVGFPFASVEPFVGLLKGFGIAMGVGMPAAYVLFHFRLPRLSFASLLVVAGLVGVFVLQLLFVIESHHSTRAVAQVLSARAAPGDSIVHAGSLEYSGGLPFYTGRNIYLLNGRRGDLDFGSRYPETQYLYLEDAEFARLWNSGRQVFLVAREESAPKVVQEISDGETLLVGRYGSRLLYVNRRPVNSEP